MVNAERWCRFLLPRGRGGRAGRHRTDRHQGTGRPIDDEERTAIAKYHRGIAPLLNPVREQLAALEEQRKEVDAGVLRTLVAMAGEPRMMRVLPRGNWLDESGEVVSPGVPAFLKPLPIDGRRATRLDLAQWMVSRDNPLVARVFVNRLWKLVFGRGLATPLDDLGAQGAWPRHPELLDWLAAEFIDSGWDVKHMLRLIVMSHTYRQSSHATAEALHKDPYNLLVARQGRFRLDAEMVRDNALAISGLLVADDRRPQRQAVSAARLLGASEFSRPRIRDRSRRGSVSPRAVHLLVPHVPASQPAGLRRADARRMHGRAPCARTRRCRRWCC